jgi:hypothetical protein
MIKIITNNKKDGKMVPFADEVGTPETNEGINILSAAILLCASKTTSYEYYENGCLFYTCRGGYYYCEIRPQVPGWIQCS